MHLQTEVGNMCNNIKNLDAENLKSANQQINKVTITWVKEVGEQDNVVHSKIF